MPAHVRRPPDQNPRRIEPEQVLCTIYYFLHAMGYSGGALVAVILIQGRIDGCRTRPRAPSAHSLPAITDVDRTGGPPRDHRRVTEDVAVTAAVTAGTAAMPGGLPRACGAAGRHEGGDVGGRQGAVGGGLMSRRRRRRWRRRYLNGKQEKCWEACGKDYEKSGPPPAPAPAPDGAVRCTAPRRAAPASDGPVIRPFRLSAPARPGAGPVWIDSGRGVAAAGRSPVARARGRCEPRHGPRARADAGALGGVGAGELWEESFRSIESMLRVAPEH